MTELDLETDYLVVGAGATALAFVDELVRRNSKATFLIVERRAKPGGHWNDAYPFVSLHQPAAFYGVNSQKLGSGGAALASGQEVLAYFDNVLKKLVATGRVRYLPMCQYRGDDRSGRAMLSSVIAADQTFRVAVRRRTVDSTYMDVQIPSTTKPKFSVSESCTFVPPNDLPKTRAAPTGHVVIGAGKTGIDTVLFLVDQGVDPESITWIVSNDAWLWNRDAFLPGKVIGWFARQLQLFAESNSLEELLLANEQEGSFLRVDPSLPATKFRCATVSLRELETLRKIKNVVRMGRVQRLEDDRIVLDEGEVPTDPSKVHVNCSADGLAKRPVRAVFAEGRITLQSLFMCQQVFSASLIGYLESRYQSDEDKNSFARVVPHPEFAPDYVSAMAVSNANFDRWVVPLGGWLKRSRLSLAHHEPALRLLVSLWKARSRGGAATVGMRRMFEEHFPGEMFPVPGRLSR